MALTARECYNKKVKENLTDAQFKHLLIDNGIIVNQRRNPSNELTTMLTSYVQDNREDYALEVFRLCEKELWGGKNVNFLGANAINILLTAGDSLNEFRNNIKAMNVYDLKEEAETAISHMVNNIYNNPKYPAKVLACYLEYVDRNMVDGFVVIYNSIACR